MISDLPAANQTATSWTLVSRLFSSFGLTPGWPSPLSGGRGTACGNAGTTRPAPCESGEMDLAELLTIPGIREECILRSKVGFMALHGGSQDRGTEQIARRAAEQAGASYYAIVQPFGLRVHLTSRLHDPGHSPCLRAFLEHVDVAISMHGFGRDGFALWFDADRGLVIEPYGPAIRGRQTGPLRGIIVGGLNAQLLDQARKLFHQRFAGYHVADERVRLGFHPRQSGQPSVGPWCPGRTASGTAWHRRFRRDLGIPDRMGSSARWWLPSSSWRSGPQRWCPRRPSRRANHRIATQAAHRRPPSDAFGSPGKSTSLKARREPSSFLLTRRQSSYRPGTRTGSRPHALEGRRPCPRSRCVLGP